MAVRIDVGQAEDSTIVGVQHGLDLEDTRGMLREELSRLQDQDGGRLSPPALHQLPADHGDFTGRVHELEELTALLDAPRRADATAPVVVSLAGMPGVGKSALAVHAAHVVAGRYSAGQLYVNLRGDGGDPLDPRDVLANLLRALGVPSTKIPDDTGGRSSLYRSSLAGQRALVVLDNALDERQVRPLLPGSPTCAVLLTSRRPLGALEGATLIDLPVLPDGDAKELLGRLVGSERARGESLALARIADLCSQLPLALLIAGGTLKIRPQWALARYANVLENERGRLDQLRLGDLEVRASFALAYRELSAAPQDARLFRLCGLLVGDEFDADVAGALLGDEASAALQRLVDARLVESVDDKRYRLHDLLRLFARERLEAEESVANQVAASLRTARWYADAATRMSGVLSTTARREGAEAATPAFAPAEERTVAIGALTWFERERAELLSMARQASRAGAWALVRQLFVALNAFLEMHSHWSEHEVLATFALTAARETGDRTAEGDALNSLGITYRKQGRLSEAIAVLQHGLVICQETGDGHSQGVMLNNLGCVYQVLGRWVEAVAAHRAAQAILHQAADRRGEADALNNLGVAHRHLGRLVAAGAFCEQALALFAELRDRYGQAQALNNLGLIRRQKGTLAEAAAAHEEARAIFHELGAASGEGQTLFNLALVCVEQGRIPEAIRAYEQDLAICRELGDRHGEGQTLANLGSAYLNLGERERAVNLWTEAMDKLHPDSPDYGRLAEQLKMLRPTHGVK